MRRTRRDGAKASSHPKGDPINWRVLRYRGDGDVVAIEPNRDYEHVFEGGRDPYWEAVQYAAKRLRENDDGADD